MEQGAWKDAAPQAGASLAVECHGEGLPVVLLHGQPGSGADWSRVVPLLSTDHLVIVPDRPGYGRTAGKATGFNGNASAVAATLRQLGIDGAVLVGHSWAGGVALAVAVHHPELVKGLVLVASVRPGESLGLVDRMLATPAVGDALSAITIGSTARVLRNRRVRALVDRRLDGRAREVINALEALTGARTRAPVWRSFVSEQRRLFDELGALAPQLGAIAAPTVVLSGGADRIVPPSVGDRLAEEIPGAVRRLIPGAHHLLPLDHPEEIAAAVREVEHRGADGTPV